MSIPQLEALALPIIVEQTTSEAHADMKNQTMRGTYTQSHCTLTGVQQWLALWPHGVDIITPGASTVAKFKTITTLNLRDSKLSQTERQVNALLCRASLPTLPP